MSRGLLVHFQEAARLAGRAATETFLLPAFLALSAASLLGKPEQACGLAAAGAACGAFAIPDRLLQDLRRSGALSEALGAPVCGGLLGLIWLLLADLGGLAGGLGVLMLAAPAADPVPALLPLALLALLFGALGLLASLLLPERWFLPLHIYLVPFLALWGAVAPLTGAGFRPELLNPVHLAALAMQGIAAGGPPLIGAGVLVALATGATAFAADCCRRGVGLRTR